MINVKKLEEEQIKPRESRRKEIAKSKKSMKEQTNKKRIKPKAHSQKGQQNKNTRNERWHHYRS